MVILGIDPGSRRTGYGLIEVDSGKLKYINSGVIRLEKISDFSLRMAEVYQVTEALIAEFSPDVAALEALIFVKSPQALIKLAQTRGAIIAALSKGLSTEVYEYAPNLIKSITAGHGHANKEGVQKFVQFLLGERCFETDDESDALAVAICHYLYSDKDPSLRTQKNRLTRKKSRGRGLSASVAHRLGN